MWQKPSVPFKVERNGVPIRSVDIKNGINPGITYGLAYAEFDAFIAAGATADELYGLDQGKYPKRFRARIVAWHNLRKSIESHSNDAVAEDMKQKSKKGKK
jgi:hypothetical protein